MARSSVSCNELFDSFAIWARLRCAVELIRTVVGIQMCIHDRIHNCQREKTNWLAVTQRLPVACNRAVVTTSNEGRPATGYQLPAVEYRVAALRKLLVHDLDLLVDHLISEPVNRHMHPVMLLPLHNKFVRLANASRIGRIPPGLCNDIY